MSENAIHALTAAIKAETRIILLKSIFFLQIQTISLLMQDISHVAHVFVVTQLKKYFKGKKKFKHESKLVLFM